jgi:ATP-dependent DNA ligase
MKIRRAGSGSGRPACLVPGGAVTPKVMSPDFVPPCIPTRAVKPPAGPDWVHEIKHDGYRLQVRRVGDQVRL